MGTRNFRKRRYSEEIPELGSDDEEEMRSALDEIRFIQKQRERKPGIPAVLSVQKSPSVVAKVTDKRDAETEKEELVLQDTFAQETAVMVEDPNMMRYVEEELAKKRGKRPTDDEVDVSESDLKCVEDELYTIPEHLKAKRHNSEESSTQWTTGIAEVQLPIEFKLRNIEETEAAKKLLQERRMMAHTKLNSLFSSNYNVGYYHRKKDQTDKTNRDNDPYSTGPSKHVHGGSADTRRREAASDEFMLERFRRRERYRSTRR